jgi:hypothetical protein
MARYLCCRLGGVADMTIYFCNAEPIDLNAIALMGVSVKVSASPIGFFGTGLKFSIATLLRTGHKVTLIRDGETIPFSVATENIRGESFDRICMGTERLGFTTKLGRNWEVWQAYRELYCNCIDEEGSINDFAPEVEYGTVFAVEGEGIEQCHRNRHDTFLATKPISASPGCEIHAGSGDKAFYRGVRAHKHGNHSLFTYNVTAKMELTEDRTVKYPFVLEHNAEIAVAGCDDESLIQTVLMAPKGTFENGFDFAGVYEKPSEAFMSVAFRLRANIHCNQAAIKLWEKYADIKMAYNEIEPDEFENEMIERAIALIARLGVKLSRHDFTIVDGLGEGIFGTVRDQRILLAHRSLDMGHRFIASTLYEEWLHKNEGLADCCRDMQNLLFEKLFAVVERLHVMDRSAKMQIEHTPIVRAPVTDDDTIPF